MSKFVVCLTALLILGLVNFSIWNKEQHLANGEVITLELAPVDPRSLMQGDYMALNYVLSQDIYRHLSLRQEQDNDVVESKAWSPRLLPVDNFVVVDLDANQLASFARLDDGQPLSDNQRKLQFRLRNDKVKFATNAFFFAEGQEPVYRDAKYGRFRVNEDGEVLLTGLLDASFTLLQAKQY